jgi:glucose uptake protein GlcU
MNIVIIGLLLIVIGIVVSINMETKEQLEKTKAIEETMRALIESGVTIKMLCEELSKMPQEMFSIILHNMKPELVTLILEYQLRENK